MSFRPDYQRIRRFISRRGVLQREILRDGQIVWCAAVPDGRNFDADTCEWLRMRPFTLDGLVSRLAEDPAHPGIFRLSQDDPGLSAAEAAAYVNQD